MFVSGNVLESRAEPAAFSTEHFYLEEWLGDQLRPFTWDSSNDEICQHSGDVQTAGNRVFRTMDVRRYTSHLGESSIESMNLDFMGKETLSIPFGCWPWENYLSWTSSVGSKQNSYNYVRHLCGVTVKASKTPLCVPGTHGRPHFLQIFQTKQHVATD